MAEQLRLPKIPETYLNAPSPTLCAPIIKYVGGKAWLLPLLLPRFHALLAGAEEGVYVEPFCGGLAMGLGIGWPRSVYADTNKDLVNLYQALATDPNQVADCLEALASLGTHEERYYEVRREVWPQNRGSLSQFEWAARALFLNKSCFNGLFRVNKKGEFNVPWGGKDHAAMPSREHLVLAGESIGKAALHCCDFDDLLLRLEALCVEREQKGRGVVVYLDPPYGATSPDMTSRGARTRDSKGKVFTAYTEATFDWAAQERLARRARALADLGCCVVASNAWTDEIRALYDGFAHFQVGVRHSVGAKVERRGKRAELVAVDAAHAGVFDAVGVRVARSRG